MLIKQKSVSIYYPSDCISLQTLTLPSICPTKNEMFVSINSFLGTINLLIREDITIATSQLNSGVNKLTISTTNSNAFVLNYLRQLLKNKLVGITCGFVSYLQLKGLGYRSQVKNTNTLILRVGLSSLSYINLPVETRVKRIKKHTLKIYGIDVDKFQTLCWTIQKVRMPSVYNDRGLIFRHVTRKLKPGKRSKF